MEIAIAIVAFIVLLVGARWLHKRAAPPPRRHSPAKVQATHDPKAVVGSGSEGQGFG